MAGRKKENNILMTGKGRAKRRKEILYYENEKRN